MSKIDSVRSSEIINDNDDKKCAPTSVFNNGSCMSLQLLVKLSEAYNKKHPNNKIKMYPNVETLNSGKYKRYLLKSFSNRLKDVCDNQRCWLNQDFVKYMDESMREEANKYTFRPKGPGGRFTWLNTLDINKVMSQYQHKYKDFKFLGAVPIDFDDLPILGIKNYDFVNMYKKNNISKFGIIFNLDEHYKKGSHWVASYADIKKGQVYYFDSYGIEPEERIQKYLRRLNRATVTISRKKEKEIDTRYNKTRHQYGGSECGLYSISFILRMVKGESFDDINGDRIPDSEVNKCRKVYFT